MEIPFRPGTFDAVGSGLELWLDAIDLFGLDFAEDMGRMRRDPPEVLAFAFSALRFAVDCSSACREHPSVESSASRLRF